MVELAAPRIERPEKDCMRKNLQDIVRLYKEIGEKIELYRQEANAEEYRKFWTDFRGKNQETVNYLSNYMVRKANR